MKIPLIGPTEGEPAKTWMERIREGVLGVLTTVPWLIGFIAVVGFVLAPGVWLVRRWSRRWWEHEAEMILHRQQASGKARLEVFKISPPDPWPTTARQQLSRAAVGLLRRRLVEARGSRIDVAATLDRTLRQVGLCRPVEARRLLTPEYLVLVDRVSLRDHQADWAEDLVERLIKEQVSCVRFEFATDPRVCYPTGEAPRGLDSA